MSASNWKQTAFEKWWKICTEAKKLNPKSMNTYSQQTLSQLFLLLLKARYCEKKERKLSLKNPLNVYLDKFVDLRLGILYCEQKKCIWCLKEEEKRELLLFCFWLESNCPVCLNLQGFVKRSKQRRIQTLLLNQKDKKKKWINKRNCNVRIKKAGGKL
jgi:hypothetical protein